MFCVVRQQVLLSQSLHLPLNTSNNMNIEDDDDNNNKKTVYMSLTSCNGGHNKNFSFCRQVTIKFSGNLSKKKKKNLGQFTDFT